MHETLVHMHFLNLNEQFGHLEAKLLFKCTIPLRLHKQPSQTDVMPRS